MRKKVKFSLFKKKIIKIETEDMPTNISHHLINAVEANNLEEVKKLILKGAIPDANYNYAIRYCCENNYLELALYLITLKSVDLMDLNAQAIIKLINRNHLDLFKEIIKSEKFILNSYVLKALKVNTIMDFNILVLVTNCEDVVNHSFDLYTELLIDTLSEDLTSDQIIRLMPIVKKNYYYGSEKYELLESVEQKEILMFISSLDVAIDVLES